MSEAITTKLNADQREAVKAEVSAYIGGWAKWLGISSLIGLVSLYGAAYLYLIGPLQTQVLNSATKAVNEKADSIEAVYGGLKTQLDASFKSANDDIDDLIAKSGAQQSQLSGLASAINGAEAKVRDLDTALSALTKDPQATQQAAEFVMGFAASEVGPVIKRLQALEADHVRIESGTCSGTWWEKGYLWATPSDKITISQNISAPFLMPFNSPPKIFIGISAFGTHSRDGIQRLDVRAVEVGTHGFNCKISTYDTGKIGTVKVDWIAIGN